MCYILYLQSCLPMCAPHEMQFTLHKTGMFLEKKNVQSRENRASNCFKPLILSVFTTVAPRLKSEQNEKEK